MRKAPALLSALAVAAVVVTSLVGCTESGTSSSASCTPYYSSGDASSTVKVSGSRAAKAKATFPTPLFAKTPQVTQNNAGTGAKIQDGEQVDYNFTVFDAKTGASLGSAGYAGSTSPRSGVAALVDNKPTYSVARSLQCATTGERYTLVTTAKDGFGAGTLASNGINDSDVLVFVVSVVDHFPGKSDGVNQLPQDGLPSVITAVNGQPGIVLQEQAVPKTLRIETVKAGSGRVVKKNETIRVKYSGWTWPASTADKPTIWPGGQDASGNTVPPGDASWTSDRAGDLTVATSGLPPGLYKALLGARVGSQLLVVIPPQDGFGASSATYGFTAKDTVIMVIDVLGIK